MKMFEADRNEILRICAESCEEGFLRIAEGRITEANDCAVHLLGLSGNGELPEELKSQETEKLLQSSEQMQMMICGKHVRLKGFHLKDGSLFVLLWDESSEETLKDELRNIRSINEELQHIFESYNDNTLYVCNGQGKTLWVGNDVAQNCGTTREYLETHTVMELEAERIFYPSVCACVLESRKPEIVTQITATGKTGISIGIPVYNSKNEITHIIALTRDLEHTLRLGRLLSEKKTVPKESEATEFQGIITCSKKMLNMIEMAKMVAEVDSTVCFLGEQGVGKKTAAQMIWQISRRKRKKFVKAGCSGLSEKEQQELFFSEGGVLAQAAGGILYLEQVEALARTVQEQLLCFFSEQAQVIDRRRGIRVFCASTQNLKQYAEERRFSEELYDFLSVVPITIPPLRERREDISLLVKHFVKQFNQKYSCSKYCSREAAAILEAYDWPGNIRELEQTVERMVVMSGSTLILAKDVPEEIRRTVVPEENNKEHVTLNEAVEELEKKMIQKALADYGTTTAAAQALGVNQSTVSRKMRKYGLKEGKANDR